MSPVMMTHEETDKGVLIHYRTPGSKNGRRLYQNKDGSLTPLGRIHYGVGKARKAAKEEIKDFVKTATSKDSTEKAGAKAETYKDRSERAKAQAEEDLKNNKINNADKNAKKAAEFDELYNKYKDKEFRLKERDEKRDRSDAEIKKAVEDRIKAFNKKTQEAKKQRAADNEARNAKLKDEIAEIRSLSDMELNKRIERLQKERTYAELVNQRSAYEQSPLRAKATKIFQDFAEQYARKALNRFGDEMLNKMMSKGRNGNNNNNSNGGSNNNSSGNQNNGSGNSPSGRLPKHQKGQIKTMAHQGKSVSDIAKSLGLTEDQVKGYMSAAGITINKS